KFSPQQVGSLAAPLGSDKHGRLLRSIMKTAISAQDVNLYFRISHILLALGFCGEKNASTENIGPKRRKPLISASNCRRLAMDERRKMEKAFRARNQGLVGLRDQGLGVRV
ncbi:MAG TPA: hypothetical protein VM492_10805, partial [Sumerlaeia bacterium]|nr:hypothetical protein [Sumerlaeia bacterium]